MFVCVCIFFCCSVFRLWISWFMIGLIPVSHIKIGFYRFCGCTNKHVHILYRWITQCEKSRVQFVWEWEREILKIYRSATHLVESERWFSLRLTKRKDEARLEAETIIRGHIAYHCIGLRIVESTLQSAIKMHKKPSKHWSLLLNTVWIQLHGKKKMSELFFNLTWISQIVHMKWLIWTCLVRLVASH